MLFLDFFGDNPFAELDLPFPPLPTEQQVKNKIKEKKADAGKRQLKLKDQKDEKSREEFERLKKQSIGLQELQKRLSVKIREMAAALPFDTLLAVQPIAPRVFFDKAARAAVVAQAWHDLLGDDGAALSDTRRKNFEKDFTRNALLDYETDEETNGAAENERGDEKDV